MTTGDQLAEGLKNKGNAAFASGDFDTAIRLFSSALELDPSNQVLYSNRSAAHASKQEWDAALQDASKTVELKPEWSKGYGRKGSALCGLGRYAEAKAAYVRGLELEPGNMQLKKGLELAESHLHQGESQRNFENPFSDPAIFDKLSANPKTAPYMSQPDFLLMLSAIQREPKSMANYIRDPRLMQAFGVLLGVDLTTAESTQPEPSSSASHRPAVPEGKADKETLKSQMTPEEQAVAREKDLGNEAYKKRDFETALRHYDEALRLDPHSVSVMNNKAAVFFETARYGECIAICEAAVESGREDHVDFKLIGKTLGRIGSAYFRLNDYEKAIVNFKKSLLEHRTPEILEKLKEAEKLKVQKDKDAYHSPELAEEERSLGNELFKQGDYAEAVTHYTEAIKRDENDPRAYSNRAACYLKLAAVSEGLKDCDKCLQLDPNYTKAYIRRAALESFKHEYISCLETCEKALKLDTDGKHRAEIQAQMTRCYNELNKAPSLSPEEARQAQQDPEVQQILKDPIMAQILQQMQKDPTAAAEHMRNPVVAAKIRKLIAAGIIRTE